MEESAPSPSSTPTDRNRPPDPDGRSTLSSSLKSLLRVEVLAICLVAFLADIMSGIITSTFSLFAEDLGATVFVVGLLTSVSGFASLVSAIPIGVQSDRLGRTRVLTFGMFSFSLATLLLAVAPGPALLIPGRILFGIATVGTFWIASAYLGDVVKPSERGVAFGMLTTSMGLGFAVGPLVGGELVERIDPRAAYLFATVVGVIGIGVIHFLLRPRQVAPKARAEAPARGSILRVGASPPLIAIGIGNILSAIAFGGAVTTIFPLRASEVGLSVAAIGTMFSLRAIASTLVRLPSGALADRIGTRKVVLGALVIEMVAVAGLGSTTNERIMLVWLIAEGIGFGAFLASAQTYLAENTVPESRGAAIGFYSMTGGIGYTVAPVLLGIVGGAFGLAGTFYCSAILVACGLLAMCWIWSQVPHSQMTTRQVVHTRIGVQGGAEK